MTLMSLAPERPDAEPDVKPPVSTTLAEKSWCEGPVTRSGLRLLICPARPEDLPRLREFFRHVSPEDLRHRFLSAMREVSEERLADMARNRDPHVVNFLAIDPSSGRVLASAMLAADENFDTGEFALCTRADSKGQGISWTMLDYLVGFAHAAGIRRLMSVEAADDRVAMQLEREMGFTTRVHPEDATLMIVERALGPS